mgnify:CR=1 FL=1
MGSRGSAGRAAQSRSSIANPLHALRAAYLLYRWRNRRKAGRGIRARVAHPAEFLTALDAAGVRNVVMRWWDEVPLTRAEAASMPGDVDVLVDDDAGRSAAWIAAGMGGAAAVELRSVTGEVGAFAGVPYYPPAFASEALERRVRHERGFAIPHPEHRLPLVLFHLCYQKAEKSGLPTGVGLPTGEAKRDYAAKLRALAADEGAALPEPLTLAALHAELQRLGWDMQLDLLVRWPIQSPWITHLVDEARARYDAAAAAAPELIVFVFRSDVTDALREIALRRLAEWFDVLETGELDAAQRRRCLRHLRGGSWTSRRGRETVGPTHYAVVNDRRPEPVTDPRIRETQPHVTNQRVRLKHALREDLRAAAETAGSRCRHALHSSDNRHEAMHFLEVIFGPAFEQKVAEYAEQTG